MGYAFFLLELLLDFGIRCQVFAESATSTILEPIQVTVNSSHERRPVQIFDRMIACDFATSQPVLDRLEVGDGYALNARGQLLEILPHEHEVEVGESHLPPPLEADDL